MGDFTHPSGREERAGGIIRTIQKVVSVQLQRDTHQEQDRQKPKAPKAAGKSDQDRRLYQN